MKFEIKNNILIKYLQKINRLVTRNTSFPILENVLLSVDNGILSLTTTNLETELIARIKISKKYIPGSATISCKKLLDICRHASHTSEIKIRLNEKKIYVSSQYSNYTLITLPVENFPNHKNFNYTAKFFISSENLKKMIEKTHFSMAKQDVRYYLNGMLLEKKNKSLYAVATDGYRLGISKTNLTEEVTPFSVIIPRKGALELYKLLNIESQLLRILVGKNNIRIYIEDFILTIQLIEGEYPDYKSVLFKNKNNPIILNHKLLKQSLSRVAILANKNFCGIEINIKNNQFQVLSDNQEEESAQDAFSIKYANEPIQISINVYYILDILNVINDENIFLFVDENNNSIQILGENKNNTLYVVMLLRR